MAIGHLDKAEPRTADAELATAIREFRRWYESLCPRCGSAAGVSFGSQFSCGHCGAVWQA